MLDWLAVGRKLAAGTETDRPEPLAEFAVGVALALALLDRGFALDTAPPWEMALVGDGVRFDPFSVRARLGEPGGSAAWDAFCAETGLAGLDLGAG